MTTTRHNAGQRIAEGQARDEIATPGGNRQSIIADDDNAPVSLKDLGVTPDQSGDDRAVARKLAKLLYRLPKATIERIIARLES
jgi:hypothetical protein